METRMGRIMDSKYSEFVRHHWSLLSYYNNQHTGVKTKSSSSLLSSGENVYCRGLLYPVLYQGICAVIIHQHCVNSGTASLFDRLFDKINRCSSTAEGTDSITTTQHGITRASNSTVFYNITETVRKQLSLQTIKEALCCWSFSIIPLVYAKTEGGVTDTTDKMEEQTSMDRLMQSSPSKSKYNVSPEEIEAFIASQSGIDRLHLLVTGIDTQYGTMQHPDTAFIFRILRVVMGGMFVMGGVFTMYKSTKKNKDKNLLGKFDVKEAVKRNALHRKAVNEAFFSGFRWCLRGGVVVTALLGTVTGISVYRNKTGVVDMSIATGLASVLVGLKYAPYDILKHFLRGLAVGTVTGIIHLMVRRTVGLTQEQQNQWLVQTILENRKLKMLNQEEQK